MVICVHGLMCKLMILIGKLARLLLAAQTQVLLSITLLTVAMVREKMLITNSSVNWPKCCLQMLLSCCQVEIWLSSSICWLFHSWHYHLPQHWSIFLRYLHFHWDECSSTAGRHSWTSQCHYSWWIESMSHILLSHVWTTHRIAAGRIQNKLGSLVALHLTSGCSGRVKLAKWPASTMPTLPRQLRCYGIVKIIDWHWAFTFMRFLWMI